MHGGLLGVVAALIVVRRLEIRLLDLTDLAAPAVALGQGLGRLGCFLAGCCYGTPFEHGLVFSNAAAAERTGVPLGVPLFPVQLADGAFHFALVATLLWVIPRHVGLKVGRMTGAWLVLEGAWRIVIEGFRGDVDRGVWAAGLTTGRLTGACAVVLGLVVLRATSRGGLVHR